VVKAEQAQQIEAEHARQLKVLQAAQEEETVENLIAKVHKSSLMG